MTPNAVYLYRSSAGVPLRRKLRFERKQFAWQSYDPATDTWTWGARDATSTLYNLHLLAASRPETVLVTEGEKDADAVIALGLLAVTSGAAGSWRRHHSEQLHAHSCTLAVVLPDHDSIGEAHAFDIAEQNLVMGIPTKIVHLPGLSEHEDVSDFLERGGTREQLLGYARCTTPITLADLPSSPPERPRSPSGAFAQNAGLIALYREKLNLPPTARGRIKVRCPFHADANPSLAVDLTQLVWYCHGCRIGGGPVDFYVKWKAKEGQTVSRRFAWHRLKATYL